MRGRVLGIGAGAAWSVWGAAANAHSDQVLRPEEAWSAWTLDPLIIVPLIASMWLYMRGWHRLRHARRTRTAMAWFLAGEAAIFVALVSPVDALGEVLLSVHMTQHMLLIALAPPLLLLGRPGLVFSAALPRSSVARLAGGRFIRPVLRGAVWASRPIAATVVHGIIIWIWHVPPIFEAALAVESIHLLEHASFFASALLFWFAVLHAGRTPRTAAVGALAGFFTFLHSGLLGGILSLAPVPLYPAYGDRPIAWGIDLLADQQLAGVIMWVLVGPAYLAATLWLLWRILGRESWIETAKV